MQKPVFQNGAANEDSNGTRGRQQRQPGTQGDRTAEGTADASQIARMA